LLMFFITINRKRKIGKNILTGLDSTQKRACLAHP